MEENEKSFTQIGLENLNAKKYYDNMVGYLSNLEFPQYTQAYYNLYYMSEVNMAAVLNIPVTANNTVNSKSEQVLFTDQYLPNVRKEGKERVKVEALCNPLIPEIKEKIYANLDKVSYENEEYLFNGISLNPQNLLSLLSGFNGNIDPNLTSPSYNYNDYTFSYNTVIGNIFCFLYSVFHDKHPHASEKEIFIKATDSHLDCIFRCFIYQRVKSVENCCYIQDNKIFYVGFNNIFSDQSFSQKLIDNKAAASLIINFCEYNDTNKNEVYNAFAAIIRSRNDNEFKSYYLHSFLKAQNLSFRNPFYNTMRHFSFINDTLFLCDNIANAIYLIYECDDFYTCARNMFPTFYRADIGFLIKEILKHKKALNLSVTKGNEEYIINFYMPPLKKWALYNGKYFELYNKKESTYIGFLNAIETIIQYSSSNKYDHEVDSEDKTSNIGFIGDLLGKFTNYNIDKTNQLAVLQALLNSSISSKNLLYIIYAPNHKNEVKKLLEIMTGNRICPLSLKGVENHLKEIKIFNVQHSLFLSNIPSNIQERVPTETMYNQQYSMFLSDDDKLPGNYKYETLAKLVTQTEIKKGDALVGKIPITNHLPIVFLSDSLEAIGTLQSEIKTKYVYIDLSDADKSLKGFNPDDKESQSLCKWFDVCFSMYGIQLYCSTHKGLKLLYKAETAANKKTVKINVSKPVDIETTIKNFINDCCEKAEDEYTEMKTLHEVYVEYYKKHYDKNAIKRVQMIDYLTKMGYTYKRHLFDTGENPFCIKDLRLKDTLIEEFNSNKENNSAPEEDIANDNTAEKISAYNAFMEEVNKPAQFMINQYNNK